MAGDPVTTRKAIAAAAAAVEPNGTDPRSFTLVNGVVLRLKAVPPMTVRAALQAKLGPAPKPPMIELSDKGRREANEDDPEYKALLEERNELAFEIGANVMLAAGTEIVEVPDGVFRPEDEGWTEIPQFFDVGLVLDSAIGRYLSWFRHYAIGSEAEWVRLLVRLSSLSGISEKEVLDAVESFRRPEARGADSDVPAPAAGDGDNVQEAAGTSST